MLPRRLRLPLLALTAAIVSALIAAVPGAAPAQDAALAQDTPGPAEPPADAQAPCTPLTDSQVVAQLVGTPVRTPTATAAVADAIARHAGTAILFGQAIVDEGQVRRLVADLDAAAPAGVAPLIAVDEEGGRVARFGRAGVTAHLPSARDQAQQPPEQVRAGAAHLAGELAALGVDLNLAPVTDLSDAPADTIVGDRSFSSDPTTAGRYALAFAAGMHDGGVATTAKHFPDHGLTTTDTHTGVATVDVSLEQLRTTHLTPYRIALPETDAVMLSHLRIPSLDPDRPVSLSTAAVDLLRSELATPAEGPFDGRPFDGVVMTDDLSMQAVAAVADQPAAAVMAVQAGVDLVLVGTVDAAAAVHERLLQALRTGELAHDRVTGAARRVLALKALDATTTACLLGLPTHYVRPR